MTEDLLMAGGMLIGLAIVGWSIAHGISSAASLVPADEVCRYTSECVALVTGG